MILKTSKFICVTLISLCSSLPLVAKQPQEVVDTDSVAKPKVQLYTSREAARKALEESGKPKFFNGIAVGVDVVGPIMKTASSWGQYEVMGRVNIKETYFPVVEIGRGMCEHIDESTEMRFSTKAPYFRIGCDINCAKNKLTNNRIFAGVRYGFSSFDYDVSAPDVIDPTWGNVVPFQVHGISGKEHWGEMLFGIESRVCPFLQIGWNLRYKFAFSEDYGEVGKPWYVPGYGRNKNGAFGATFNVIFEL